MNILFSAVIALVVLVGCMPPKDTPTVLLDPPIVKDSVAPVVLPDVDETDYDVTVNVPDGWRELEDDRRGYRGFTNDKNYAKNHPGISVMEIITAATGRDGGVGLEGYEILKKEELTIDGEKYLYESLVPSQALIDDVATVSPDDADFYKEFVKIAVHPVSGEFPEFSFGGGREYISDFEEMLKTVSLSERSL